MNLVASLGLGAIQPDPRRESQGSAPLAPRVARVSTRTQNDFHHTELILRFSAWAHTLHRFPTVEAVQERFQVSRATAYRWRNALAAAHGIQCPANAPEGGDE